MVPSSDDLARNFDHHDEGLDNIFDVYRELRQKCPVGYSEKHGGFHFVTRYEDIYRIEQDWETFSVQPTMLLPSFGNKRPMIPIDIDPPMLQKYRRILLPLFAAREIDKVEFRVREAAGTLIDGLAEQKRAGRTEVDVSYDFARPLPMIVFCQMMGLPLDHYRKFQDWVDRIIYQRTGNPAGAEAAADEVYAYFEEFLAARRSEAGADDIMGSLMAAEIDGRPLSKEELLDYSFLLFLAALDTTAWSIRSALWYLAGNPADQARLREDPALIPLAVEEFLRCFSPVQGMGRTVTRSGVEIGGTQLAEGDRVLILFGSGNRDEEEFPDPDRVVLDRLRNRHSAFGIGIHRCLGSNLGRREMKVALEEFLRRVEHFGFTAGPEPVWHGIGPLPLEIAGVAR